MRSMRFLNFWAYTCEPAEIIVYSVNIVYDTSNLIVQNQTGELIEHKRYKGCTFFYHFFMKTIVNNNIWNFLNSLLSSPIFSAKYYFENSSSWLQSSK